MPMYVKLNMLEATASLMSALIASDVKPTTTKILPGSRDMDVMAAFGICSDNTREDRMAVQKVERMYGSDAIEE